MVIEELPQDVIVGLGVHRLLADESSHARGEFLVVDQRKGLVVGLHEPPLALREQEIEHADEVRRDRVAGYPVERDIVPVECHVAGVQLDGPRIGRRCVPRCTIVGVGHGVHPVMF